MTADSPPPLDLKFVEKLLGHRIGPSVTCICLPCPDGLSAIRSAVRDGPPVFVVSAAGNPIEGAAVIAAGARGYVSRDNKQDVQNAYKAVTAGECYLDADGAIGALAILGADLHTPANVLVVVRLAGQGLPWTRAFSAAKCNAGQLTQALDVARASSHS